MPDVCEDLSPFPLDHQAAQCGIGPGQAVAHAGMITACWASTETGESELYPVQNNRAEYQPETHAMGQGKLYPLRNANTKVVEADFYDPKRASSRANLVLSRFWESVVAADTATPLASLWDLNTDKPWRSVNKQSKVATETTAAGAVRKDP